MIDTSDQIRKRGFIEPAWQCGDGERHGLDGFSEVLEPADVFLESRIRAIQVQLTLRDLESLLAEATHEGACQGDELLFVKSLADFRLGEVLHPNDQTHRGFAGTQGLVIRLDEGHRIGFQAPVDLRSQEQDSFKRCPMAFEGLVHRRIPQPLPEVDLVLQGCF